MIFEPVWVSSVDHLRACKASYLRRLFGVCLLRDSFPYVQGWLGIPWRIPIVMFSSGRLRIDDGLLEFEATEWGITFNRLYNLRTNWKFELRTEDVTAAESIEFVSPILRYYSLPFTRIRTNRSGDLTDFLLCVSGMGPLMGKIRKRNAAVLPPGEVQ